jgi:hypothetical protein
MIVLSHPPDEQQDNLVKFCKTQVRYAGQKVKNQKNKDTFRRSIGKKFVEKEDYFLPNYNIKCFVRYMVSTFTSLVEECTLIMGM